jgi:hypothetical protein
MVRRSGPEELEGRTEELGGRTEEIEGRTEELGVAGVEDPEAAAGVKEEPGAAAGAGRSRVRGWGWGKMRSGPSDPCWILAQVRGAGAFLGRGEPCPGAKLNLSFSTGQGREVFFSSFGQCPYGRAGLPND